jgi:hypothetical protein
MTGFAFFTWIAIGLGYSLADLVLPAVAIITASALLLGARLAIRSRPSDLSKVSFAIITGLGLIVIGEGSIFHNREGRSWKLEWGPKIERQMFDFRLSSARRSDRGTLSTTRRPARFVIGASYDAVVKHQNSVAYNKCFYAPMFCVLGYNNLRLSLPHLSYRQAISDPVSGPKLLGLVRQAQTLVVMPANTSFNLAMIETHSDLAEIETAIPGVEVSIMGYGESWTRYKLSTTTAVRVVENEIWTRGWSFRLCQNSQCLAPQSTEHTSEYLRTWIVPPGDWDIEVYFEVHSERYAWMLFYAGVFLLLAAGLLGLRLGRSSVRALTGS